MFCIKELCVLYSFVARIPGWTLIAVICPVLYFVKVPDWSNNYISVYISDANRDNTNVDPTIHLFSYLQHVIYDKDIPPL